MQKSKPKKTIHSRSQQQKPGLEEKMKAEPPEFNSQITDPGKKLHNKVAIITGGDSGIGRAVAVTFAKHGADLTISYLKAESKDAKKTKDIIESLGRKCLLIQGDISKETHCRSIVSQTKKTFGKIDILVNNAAIHSPQKSILDISAKQLETTFRVNVFSMFYIVKAALKYMQENSCIINTASVTAYRGSGHLIDYSATKGAIISFTRSLSASLMDKKIRVNAVAPGPVWTPLIVSSMKPKEIATFGSDCPMGRVGQPVEIAPSFLFLASDESGFISGQVLHPNGGEIVNG
ncbi:MAG: glucose 1-dehydrogenase [Bacteroidota bacterium]|nr:glucose 1-dehydrogenase [Bacteroidota bacterium]